MLSIVRFPLSKLLLAASLILLLFLALNVNTPWAIALIREMEEVPGQILYQSRHSLPDQNGNSWQVVLFKRIKDGKIKQVNLRLVGFPGLVEFTHPQPLKLTTITGKTFEAQDQLAQATPAPNVGEYNLEEILPLLSLNESVQLTLSLNKGRSPTIKIPIPVMLEWLEVASYK